MDQHSHRGLNQALASASAGAETVSAAARLLGTAKPIVDGATPKNAAQLWQDARANLDDAAAHFSSADAKAGHTGDWCNLVLGQSSV